MFTGLVQAVGHICAIRTITEGKEFIVRAPTLVTQMSVGDSVAVNGACLTVVHFNQDSFTVQAVHVTLKKTNLHKLQIHDLVNLELALKASDRLGGHFVQGHVNGMGIIKSMISRGNNYEVSICLDPDLAVYIMKEGSITLDGVSLTIADCMHNIITVSIIPHTWQVTNFYKRKVGDYINIEIDLLAKYVIHVIERVAKKDYAFKLL